MQNLKLSGNALKGSRPVLSFSPEFDASDDRRLVKDVLTSVFTVQQGYPKSKPFIDHVLQFSIADDRVWLRNYQVVDGKGDDKLSLVEIGPRFCMQLVKIIQGCFSGQTVYVNERYVSPNVTRRAAREDHLRKAQKKRIAKEKSKQREGLAGPDDVFDTAFDEN